MNKTKLDTLLKEGKISLKDYEKGIDILNRKIDGNLSEIKLIDKDSKLDQTENINKMTLEEEYWKEDSTETEISDRQLQEQIFKTLKLNQIDNRTIKNWVVFWSWFTIITVVIYIIVLLKSL